MSYFYELFVLRYYFYVQRAITEKIDTFQFEWLSITDINQINFVQFLL